MAWRQRRRMAAIIISSHRGCSAPRRSNWRHQNSGGSIDIAGIVAGHRLKSGGKINESGGNIMALKAARDSAHNGALRASARIAYGKQRAYLSRRRSRSIARGEIASRGCAGQAAA